MADLEHVLAKALTGLLVAIDLSDDDIDPTPPPNCSNPWPRSCAPFPQQASAPWRH